MIKAVIFDCFGVLVRSSLEPFYAEFFSKDADKRTQAKELDRASSAGEISYQEFVAKLAALAGISQEQTTQRLDQTPPNEPLLAYIRNELKPQYKIGFLSNASDNWMDSLFVAEQQALFDDVVLSYQYGCAKPDPRLYKTAAERLGLEPSECLFVDDIAAYCDGARAVGMKAVQYRDFNQAVADIEKLLQPSN